MWTAWTLQQELKKPASKIFKIARLAHEKTNGLAVWWTCFQFDRAVTTFGRYVENKLHEMDDFSHKPRYTLSELLDDTEYGVDDLKRVFPNAVVKG